MANKDLHVLNNLLNC